MDAELLTKIRGDIGKMRMPTSFDKVYKDECVMSFDTPYAEGGLFVNLNSWQGFGSDHVARDVERTGASVYLHLRWQQVLKEEPEPSEKEKPSHLVVDGGNNVFDETRKFDIVKENNICVVTGSSAQGPIFQNIPLPNTELPEFVSNVAEAIIKHDGMQAKMAEEVWTADSEIFESKYAKDLVLLNNGKKISNDPSTWRCEMSGATENLWLNLSTGYIGGGRKNWDGSGGSGGALKHFEDTGNLYPLCVKLGTVTAHGADVYSYAPDEDTLVKDPLLAEHLSHWGIDIMKLEKTAKTMGEMEVDLNLKYDWAASMEGGKALEKMYGAGLVGLRNLGSSCYLNSVVQCILNIPEMADRYLSQRRVILESSPAEPQSDFVVQFSKLAEAVLTDAYVEPEGERDRKDSKGNGIPKLEKYVITPRMFKHTVAKGHQEFSGGKQQDASDYFIWLLTVAEREERIGLKRAADRGTSIGDQPFNSLFTFHTQEKLTCSVTNQVRLQSPAEQSDLSLIFPEDITAAAVARKSPGGAAGQEGEAKATADGSEPKRAKTEEVLPSVPFDLLLSRYTEDETLDYTNPSLGQPTPTKKNVRFRSFPKYLMVKLNRAAQTPDWRCVKVDDPVSVPDFLDLTAFARDGLAAGQTEMPEASDSNGSGGDGAAGFQMDEGVVATLMSMGFGENAAKRAAIMTDNAPAEVATDWMMTHMDDPDFNDDVTALLTQKQGGGGGGGGGDEGVTQEGMDALAAYGFSEMQCRCALKATQGNLERAVDWIFAHEGEDLEAAANGSTGGGAGQKSAVPEIGAAGEGKYQLMAMVSHLGPNMDHGHYVCHVKKGDKWALFDDDRVARSPTPPADKAYMVLYAKL